MCCPAGCMDLNLDPGISDRKIRIKTYKMGIRIYIY